MIDDKVLEIGLDTLYELDIENEDDKAKFSVCRDAFYNHEGPALEGLRMLYFPIDKYNIRCYNVTVLIDIVQ